jgi:hypothetical protein
LTIISKEKKKPRERTERKTSERTERIKKGSTDTFFFAFPG